jgi:hypothetical protein
VEKLDHWETLLTAGNSGAFKPLNLRLDFPHSPNKGNTASAMLRPCARIAVDIPPALAAMMRAGARGKGRTAFSTLISAWALTLRQQVGSSRYCSPRYRMPLNLRKRRFNMSGMKWRELCMPEPSSRRRGRRPIDRSTTSWSAPPSTSAASPG